MAMFLDDPGLWLPFVFAGLMGLSILVYVVFYVVFDGFDLGVGILLPADKEPEKDMMIASIGPFWDANETWLVLAVGILLVAFPVAHGVILQAHYLPVFVMLVDLIGRGVAFEFRAKVVAAETARWNRLFFVGSLFTALAQGWMLGVYIMGLEVTTFTLVFAALTAVCLAAGYCFIGATWLVLKTEGTLQRRAVHWAKMGLAFTGLAYSFYPYVVPKALTIYDAAAAPESLAIILAGVIVVMPIIIGATVFAYRVFGGKATKLHYD